MDYEIIAKKAEIPDYDRSAICVQYIQDLEVDITEARIQALLAAIPDGVDECLFLDPDGEGDFMEVLSDEGWLALGCCFDDGAECYYSYNPAYADSRELTGLRSGGQSPIEKRLALTDMAAGVAAVEYFIRTGKLYPGIEWARQA
ncbi:MAG: hypothetical protein HFF90_02050 [Oscillibacter sp.]|nr:hypothetical protein [Oscillibacter sp.]